MLRTNMTQKQCEVSNENSTMYGFLPEHYSSEMPYIIRTMMKIITTKAKKSMDAETHIQFSKISDAVIRMAEETRK